MNDNESGGRTCPVCGAESELVYRCSECGKLFEENNRDAGRSVLGGGS